MAEEDFDEIAARLDEIIAQVRSKDTSLERSLDLFDEAIELGSRAVDMVDSQGLSEREAELVDAAGSGAADRDRPHGDAEPPGTDEGAPEGPRPDPSAAEA